jgi:hypothetical protein
VRCSIKLAVHRLRCRFRDLLVEEIGQTMSGPDEVAEELQHLMAAQRPPH